MKTLPESQATIENSQGARLRFRLRDGGAALAVWRCSWRGVAGGLVFLAVSGLVSAGQAANNAVGQSSVEPMAVTESARAIPVAVNVDVVVVGGSSAAVAAAVAARQAGASVFVLAPCPYLGEDLAGPLRLWLEKDETAKGPLAEAIFGRTGFSTPGNLKRALNQALVAAKVDFLYSCYATDVLTDGAGKLCGVVMANRSGRQAVIAKVIIDATENATVARLAGAKFSAFGAGPQTVKWVTIATTPRTDDGQTVRKLSLPLDLDHVSRAYGPAKKTDANPTAGAAWLEYTLRLDLPDGSWAARAKLEQMVRDQTYTAGQLYSADVLFVIPADSIVAAQPLSGGWSGAEQIPLDVFRPGGIERLWVLGGCAGVPRDQAEKLLRPLAFLEVGKRVGTAAAAEVSKIPVPQAVHVVRTKTSASIPGDVKELAFGIRPFPKPVTVQQDEGALPVLGRYDVVVVGGGTAGAPAGIAAARQGAKTLVIEYLHGLGGVGTLGMIGGYWHGNRVGFTSTVPMNSLEVHMEWLRCQVRQAHGDIWFGVLGCGALVEGNRVTGVVVSTPQGRGVVLAKAVIDGTGNSDIPISVGADYMFVNDPTDVLAMQMSHLPSREIGASYINGNVPPINDANPIGATRFFQRGPRNRDGSFDIGQLIDSRERRRVVGDYCLDWLDVINKRTFPDSIELGRSNYDSHSSLNTHVFFAFRGRSNPYHGDFESYVPYRCLLPKGLEGILVVGLGMSAHRDAMPIVRMQPDMQNQGYAAGVAAAMAAKTGITPRQVDVKSLQRHLIEVGNLKPEVLTHTDSYPMPAARIKTAVDRVVNDYTDLEVIMANPQQAPPLLREAYAAASGANKSTYACVLGAMGNPTGVPTLLEVAAEKPNKRGHSPQQQAIVALGYARDPRAIPVLTSLASQGDRNAAEALGRIGDPAGAAPLARLLQTPPAGLKAQTKDLVIICALWRCGDKDGLAKKALESIVAEDDGLKAAFAWKLLSSPARTSIESSAARRRNIP